ncbi:MAG: cell division protein FtsK, partial [Actinobacteria bacterium]|nr:cell division protein FtsK [Actinomycetota bacterium]
MAQKSPSPRARAGSPAKRPVAASPTRTPRNQPVQPKPSGGPSAGAKAWLTVASWVGASFRFLSSEELPKELRRDGVPFALLLFASAGVVVEWFNYDQTWAQMLDNYTVGGFFGRLAFALP